MELSYKQLEAVLSAHFRIHPDRIGRFQSRIKQLQRLNFPSGVNVGRGEKMKYSSTHLFQFVAAFELINQGIPGGTAVEIVKLKWDNFAAAFGLALWHRRRFKTNRQVFARLMNATLYDLQGSNDPAEIPNVFVEDEKSLARIFMRNSERLSQTYTVLCVTDIVFSVLDHAKRAHVTDPLGDDETSGWKVRTNLAEAYWMRAEDEWLLDDDEMPAGDPPYFIARVMRLLVQRHEGLAQRLIKTDAVGLSLQKEEIEAMQSLGLLKVAPNGAMPLTPLGRAVCQYMRREDDDVVGS